MKDYHTTDKYIYNFDTAFFPPFQWLFTVSKKYPSITFKIKYDIDGYNDAHILIVHNGDVIYDDRFSTLEEIDKSKAYYWCNIMDKVWNK